MFLLRLLLLVIHSSPLLRRSFAKTMLLTLRQRQLLSRLPTITNITERNTKRSRQGEVASGLLQDSVPLNLCVLNLHPVLQQPRQFPQRLHVREGTGVSFAGTDIKSDGKYTASSCALHDIDVACNFAPCSRRRHCFMDEDTASYNTVFPESESAESPYTPSDLKNGMCVVYCILCWILCCLIRCILCCILTWRAGIVFIDCDDDDEVSALEKELLADNNDIRNLWKMEVSSAVWCDGFWRRGQER